MYSYGRRIQSGRLGGPASVWWQSGSVNKLQTWSTGSRSLYPLPLRERVAAERRGEGSQAPAVVPGTTPHPAAGGRDPLPQGGEGKKGAAHHLPRSQSVGMPPRI